MGEILPFPKRVKINPAVSPDQLNIGEIENVIPITTERNLGNAALRGPLPEFSTDPDPYGDLGGGIRQRSPEYIKAERKLLLQEFNSANGDFQEYVSDNYPVLFDGPNGKSFIYGMWSIRRMVESTKGNPGSDIPDFLRGIKRAKDDPLTEREKAVRILECEGLGILERTLIQYRNGDQNGAAKNAVQEIGGNYANLHTDYIPGGAVEKFESIIEAADELMQTYGVLRKENDRIVLKRDPILIIRLLRSGLAKTAGFTSHKAITEDHRRAAAATLNVRLTDPAA